MKLPKALWAWGVRAASPLFHRLGTAAGGTLLGWGATGEQADLVMGAMAVIIGVAVDVLVKKLNEGQ